MVIVEAKCVVSIKFDLDMNISLGVDLGEGTIDLASGTTGVDDYVTAYKCNENFNQDNSPLVPNEKLLVCIESNLRPLLVPLNKNRRRTKGPGAHSHPRLIALK